MKKILITILACFIFIMPALARTDRSSEDYLKNKRHFSPANYFAERVVEKILQKTLVKNCNGDFKINLKAYTLSSMKKGIFKHANFVAENLSVDEIPIERIRINTISDYNWIDYRQDPIKYMSDMEFAYEMLLTEDAVNQALKNKKYQEKLQKVNIKAYPLFTLHDVKVKVINDRMKILMDYSLPLAETKKVRTFVVSTKFAVSDNLIKASNVAFDTSYGNLGNKKVANLINLLDPLSFTLSILNTNDCKGRIENVKIIDNIIQINGRIYVKANG